MKKINFKNKEKIIKVILLVFLVFITLFAYFLFINYKMPDNLQISKNEISGNTVIKIIDGDTFQLKDQTIVRLLCIDTPEKNKKGYEEAKQFLESLIIGKKVRLEKGIDETDKYGRALMYVYVNASENSISNAREIFVNKEIIAEGYGKLFDYKTQENCEKLNLSS